MDWSTGFLTPWTFVPHHLSPYTNEMTFIQRCYNTFVNVYDHLMRKFNYIRAQNKLAKVYFSEGIKGIIPSVQEMEKNVDLTLVNGHRSFFEPRPKMPGLIDITGAHIRPALGLPEEMKVSSIVLLNNQLKSDFFRVFLTVQKMA
jgi:UDP-glucoronosyl and UDP-glucosyl transferase